MASSLVSLTAVIGRGHQHLSCSLCLVPYGTSLDAYQTGDAAHNREEAKQKRARMPRSVAALGKLETMPPLACSQASARLLTSLCLCGIQIRGPQLKIRGKAQRHGWSVTPNDLCPLSSQSGSSPGYGVFWHLLRVCLSVCRWKLAVAGWRRNLALFWPPQFLQAPTSPDARDR
ncbi:hypothetical protein BBK36DRAFT_1143405 [Trichoderma citrinoviride]|uniref:Uncharacterized protein n=1 Tax=Trichoderma citrinoviride TaxID=58853 RepID=A0A2T4B308_9HYPO|nr:hypothetical protein BBK36DRAFT_1143405 [Trichoderma citrinoviride]PTB63690.1 hypothetical protein BBK36DRAFT_1143405 [Trichoderma citrinoviride]